MNKLRALVASAALIVAGPAQAQINNPPSRFTAPTAPTGTNNEQIATTRFVKNALSGISVDASHITGVLPIAHGGTACSVPSGTCLDNITGFGATGIMVRAGPGTYFARTIIGTANEIGVVNGDGIAGNPTLSLPAALTFTGKTVTGGTFVSGAFNGTLGTSTPASAAVTTLNATGASTLAALSATIGTFSSTVSGAFNGTLGATTPASISATTGTFSSTIHLPNDVSLLARNAANSGDVSIAYLDASDIFQIGGGNRVKVGSVAASTSTTTGALNVDGGVGIVGTLYIGSSLHIPNNTAILARNAANSLDVGVAYLDPSDVYQIGGGDNVHIASPEASSSSSTGALRVDGGIYAGAQSYFVGPLGLGIATPTTIGAGTGLAAGITGGAGKIFVTPYVDSNLTTSSFVVQTVDQPAASTNGGTGYEYAVIGGIKTTHNDGSLGPNKVGVAGMAQISGATSGNGWGGYFLVSLDSGSRAGSIAVGVEIDSINSTTTDRNYSNLGTPSYGLQITGTSNKTNTAALLLSGAPGVPQWYAGIVFNNFRSTTADYGIDLAFDANTFGVTAIRLPNNQTIAWKRAAGTNINGVYLDGADVFQVGGGLPVRVASTLNVVGGYISNGTNGVTCAGINAATFTSLNGIVTHC